MLTLLIFSRGMRFALESIVVDPLLVGPEMKARIMKRFLLAGSIIASLAVSAPSFAYPITVFDAEMPKLETLSILTPVRVDAYVGQLTLTTSIGTLYAWCIDLDHDIFLGGGQQLPYDVATLSVPQGQEIAGLVAFGNGLLAKGGGTDEQSAAIQLAIWTVEYGSVFTWSGGTDGLPALVQEYVAEAPFLQGNASELFGYGVPQPQNLASLVPEPMSLLVFGAGLIGLGLVRRLR
jgi:hypothetical protein